jgi:hypothetical protein
MKFKKKFRGQCLYFSNKHTNNVVFSQKTLYPGKIRTRAFCYRGGCVVHRAMPPGHLDMYVGMCIHEIMKLLQVFLSRFLETEPFLWKDFLHSLCAPKHGCQMFRCFFAQCTKTVENTYTKVPLQIHQNVHKI